MPVTLNPGITLGLGITLGSGPAPTPPPPVVANPGQIAFTTPGTWSWTAPAGVTSVCVVCVGGGGSGSSIYPGTGSGGGGGLGWKNNIPVTPGQSYTVVVGAGGVPKQAGGNSYFINLSTVAGYGGTVAAYSSDVDGTRAGFVGDGGGQGGAGCGNGNEDDPNTGRASFGGGGAGGYTGNGGNGAGGQNVSGTDPANGYAGYPPAVGSGGGAGGGMYRAGGGVGILGKGSDGIAKGRTFSVEKNNWIYYSGTPGSGGVDQTYGGGGSITDSAYDSKVGPRGPSIGSGGAVRIIWGTGRAFPDTNTGDV